MKPQRNTVTDLFESELKVTIEHISLGKKAFTECGCRRLPPVTAFNTRLGHREEGPFPVHYPSTEETMNLQ